jgi:hypothetical protein
MPHGMYESKILLLTFYPIESGPFYIPNIVFFGLQETSSPAFHNASPIQFLA